MSISYVLNSDDLEIHAGLVIEEDMAGSVLRDLDSGLDIGDE